MRRSLTFAAGNPKGPFSRRSACLESVFYVIYYVTKIVHDDSASGDYILRVNICFGTCTSASERDHATGGVICNEAGPHCLICLGFSKYFEMTGSASTAERRFDVRLHGTRDK